MSKELIVPLTSIRGLAAVMVAFSHCGFEHFWDWARIVVPFGWSSQAVDLFFVLSAFVLLHNYGNGESSVLRVKDYLVARIARIYPLHVATMMIVGALALVALLQGRITGEYKTVHVLQQLLMVNAWPVIGMERTWNYPAWSISIEWFLYLFLLPPLVRIGALKSLPTAAIVVVVSTTGAAIVIALSRGTLPITTGWIALLRGVSGFLAGWGAWSIFRLHRPVSSLLSRWSDAWMALSLAVILLAGLGWISLWCLLPLGPLVIVSLSIKSNTITCWLMNTPVMIFLGEISYALYMTHAVVAKMLNASLFRGPRISDPLLRALGGAVYAGGLILLAWLV